MALNKLKHPGGGADTGKHSKSFAISSSHACATSRPSVRSTRRFRGAPHPATSPAVAVAMHRNRPPSPAGYGPAPPGWRLKLSKNLYD